MSYNKYSILLLIILFLAAFTPVLAQNVSKEVSTVNVADLTDAQIKEMLDKAQASGLSDIQVLDAAKAKGMSDDQLDLLKRRIENFRKAGANTTDNVQPQQRQSVVPPDNTTQQQQQPQPQPTPPSKIFGADLFRNGNLTFEPDLKLATPVNYHVGPDDELDVNVYGKSIVSWQLKVSPDGTINIPGIGVVNVSGKTIEQATAIIKKILAGNRYAIGKGTNVQVSLGNIRSIKVILVGEVERPGSYTLPSLATVFNALYAAGGPNDNGSFRQIEVIRNNHIVKHLDVYDFLVKGEQKDNITLQDQDIIRVPTYRTRVELRGEVKRPALFEVLPGEVLQDVIGFAGGFTDQAYTSRIEAVQISDQQRRITDIVENDYKNYIPLRGDVYVVNSILDRYENRVTINGAVFRPGEYELRKGLTLSQLIQSAAGLKEDAFTPRATIIRLKPDNTTEIIPFDVHGLMSKSIADIPLQREDIITITSIFDLRDEYKVVINGEVRKPGEFAYADSMSVGDLVLQAGGFTQGASLKRVAIARRTVSDPTSKNSTIANVFTVDVDASLNSEGTSFKLKPFDIVSVYTLPGYQAQSTVKVEGEVLFPGSYTIQKKNEKISDILARTGGLTAWANVGGGTLVRNNSAILGADKGTKITTGELESDRLQRLRDLQKTNKDSVVAQDLQPRNNYVGIDLKEILAKPGSKSDLIVEDGDIIRIPKELQLVRVNGEVLYPSAVVFKEGESFNDYVINAGGFSSNALKRNAYIVYPNGTVKGTKKFLFFNVRPEVMKGSEIYVPKKPEPKAVAAAERVAMATGIASLGAIILGILNLLKL